MGDEELEPMERERQKQTGCARTYDRTVDTRRGEERDRWREEAERERERECIPSPIHTHPNIAPGPCNHGRTENGMSPIRRGWVGWSDSAA